MDIFDRLNRRGLTVILVTHDPRVAAYAHRVISIQDGRIIAEDAPHVASPADVWGVVPG
jgi:macrolide transport system ATP-binding/permease protein